jgi:DNA adenine methylase
MDEYSIANNIIFDHPENTIVHPSQYKKVTPPFGYFGSKNKLALRLCQELPPHNCWVEAFGGSLSMTLAKSPAPIEIVNDLDKEVINLFLQLRNNSEELCRQIALTPYSKYEFDIARIELINDNEIERARKFLIQAMMAINGVFGKGKGGFSYSQSYSRSGKDARVSRWYNLPERLSNVVERLRGIRIENRDAIDLLKMFINRPATLVYLDPPYLGDRTQGYENDANDENFHKELLKTAVKAKCMIFISGYYSDLYDSILTERKGWHKKSFETYTKDIKGKTHDRSEYVWINKYYQKALELNKVPIKLTTKELRENKINPER